MQIAAGKFKTHCLAIMDDVRTRHESVIITKRGKPVAKLVPVDETPSEPLFGLLRGHARITGDIVASTGEVWHADE
jgi:prevent-host-death family protein